VKKTIVAIASACMLLAGMVEAEIIVSAGRVPTAAEDVSSSVTSISSADLERLQVRALPEAIRMVPGVHVTRNGGPGQTSDFYIRGAKTDQVLVLIDGIEMNDSSLIGRNADLSLLDPADIQSVEVLRGPQSALYGGDAMGGVINIITKRGEGAPSVSLSAEVGSFETYHGAAAISGSTGIVDYAFTATHIDSAGISAANEADGNREKDGFDRTGFSGRIGLAPLENLSFDFVARYIESSVDYDNGAGEGADTPDNVTDAERLYLGGAAELGLFDSQWQQRLSVSRVSHDREFTSTWGENWYEAEQTKVGWQHDFYQEDRNVVSAGVEIEEETAETDALPEVDSEIKSVYLQDQLHLGALVLVGGLRLDDHDTFGEEVTGRLGATLKLKDAGTRFKATYGSGFKAPSLYQLYAPASPWGAIGNADLNPETSTSWDVGVEQKLCEKAVVGVTYFDSEYEDLIDFVAGYVNESEATVKGVEFNATAQLCDAVRLSGTYTYTDSEDSDGAELSRRPKHRATADLHYRWDDAVNLSLGCVYVGKRQDAYFSSTEYVTVEEELPGYVVFNLAASWQLSDTVKLFGRVENLFDKDYEELAGYGTPGVSGYGGVKITL